MNKDLQIYILEKYLSQFTFDKLYCGAENAVKDDNSSTMMHMYLQVLDIVTLKRVCKSWRDVIKKYMAREWGLVSRMAKKGSWKTSSLSIQSYMKNTKSLERIINGDIKHVCRDKDYGTIKILALKRYKEFFFVRYINFHAGKVPKINIALDMPLVITAGKFRLGCTEKYCSYSFGQTVEEILFGKNIGPVIKYEECKCDEERRVEFTVLYPEFMKTFSVMYIPKLNNLEINFPSDSLITFEDIDREGERYLKRDPYYRSICDDISIIIDYAFFQGIVL